MQPYTIDLSLAQKILVSVNIQMTFSIGKCFFIERWILCCSKLEIFQCIEYQLDDVATALERFHIL